MGKDYSRDTVFVGGAWAPSHGSERIEVISPFSEQVIATVPKGTMADVDAAVAAARRAFDTGPWPRMSVAERVEAVGRLRAVFERRKEDVARAITAEMGSPITQSRAIQATVPLMMLDEQRQIASESYRWSELRRSASGNALVRRQPKGVARSCATVTFAARSSPSTVATRTLAVCTTAASSVSSAWAGNRP